MGLTSMLFCVVGATSDFFIDLQGAQRCRNACGALSLPGSSASLAMLLLTGS